MTLIEQYGNQQRIKENAWSRQQMIARNAFGEMNWAIKIFNDRKLKLLEANPQTSEDKEKEVL